MNRIFNESVRIIDGWINSCTNNEIAVLGIVTAIVIALISLYCIRRPKLTYLLTISQISFPKEIKNLKNLLQIKYNKKNITNLSVVKIVVTNEGREIAKDFSNPIKIQSIDCPIIYAKIDTIETSENLNVSLIEDTQKECVSVNIDYLNENDKIVIYLAFDTDKKPELVLSARCHGCSSIKEVEEPRILRTTLTVLSVISLFTLFIFYNVYITLKKEVDSLEAEVKTHRQEVLEGYRKLYDKYEDDEKNINQRTKNVETYRDILSAYMECAKKINYYITESKSCLQKKITNEERYISSTPLPK